MKDKIARERITDSQWELKRLDAEIRALQKDAEALREELAEVRKLAAKEPTMYTTSNPFYVSFFIKPTHIPLARAIRLILKHLNLELHSIPEGHELKEVVDDDKAND